MRISNKRTQTVELEEGLYEYYRVITYNANQTAQGMTIVMNITLEKQ